MNEDMYRRRRHEYSDGSDDEMSAHALPMSNERAAASSTIDFGAVSLYVPALQITFALMMACTASIFAGALSSVLACNAVRTVVLTSIVGVLFIIKPFRASYARGMDIMFDALRPAMMVYIVAIVCEQLLHSCRSPLDEPPPSNLRHGLSFVSIGLMAAAGFWQAWHPQTQTDYPFVMTCGALLLLTIFAPAPTHGMGPLCDVPTTVNAIERLVRTLTFSWVYLTLAYACEPAKHTIGEVMLSATRAATGSVWTLLCNRWLLFGGVLQGIVVVFVRLNRASRYNHLHLRGTLTDDEEQRAMDGGSMRDDESILSEDHTEFHHAHAASPSAMLGNVVVDARDGVVRMQNDFADLTRLHEPMYATSSIRPLAVDGSEVTALDVAKQKMLSAHGMLPHNGTTRR